MTDLKLMIFAIQTGDANMAALVGIPAEEEATIGKLEQASG
jgi:hypothetical protein